MIHCQGSNKKYKLLTEKRRNRADIIEIFKMLKELSAISWLRFFHMAGRTRRSAANFPVLYTLHFRKQASPRQQH